MICPYPYVLWLRAYESTNVENVTFLKDAKNMKQLIVCMNGCRGVWLDVFELELSGNIMTHDCISRYSNGLRE
jgi:hypothetical protein